MTGSAGGRPAQPLEPAEAYIEGTTRREVPFGHTALSGQVDSACIWLETAAENGFQDWAAVKKDPDFDNMRKVDCYRKVLSGK